MKTHKSIFTPKNPDRYIGTFPIIARSSWESQVMRLLDEHPMVLQWSSESISIPYINPLTGKASLYYPDLFAIYQNKTGKNRAEVIEIKPIKEADPRFAKTKRDRAMLKVNIAKWEAARAWCNRQGFTFMVLTELDLFRQTQSGKPPRKTARAGNPRSQVRNGRNRPK